MARRYGKINRYRSRIRRCAISGLRGYEHEMIHGEDGGWYLPRWFEKGRSTAGPGALSSTLYSLSTRMALVLTTPEGKPLGWWDETSASDDSGSIRVGGD